MSREEDHKEWHVAFQAINGGLVVVQTWPTRNLALASARLLNDRVGFALGNQDPNWTGDVRYRVYDDDDLADLAHPPS